MNTLMPQGDFLYTYAYTEDEKALCSLEMRSFFGYDSDNKILKSPIRVAPSRSPFMKERLEVFFESPSLEEVINYASSISTAGQTFKVLFVKINDLASNETVDYDEKRQVESRIGKVIEGEADMHNPEVVFGLMPFEGRWYFGRHLEAESVWFKHLKKPQQYSTALSTRVARAVANIAVPEIAGIRAIDPCCGIGTVLVEGLSMGIDIVGRDLNPLVVAGSRENIAFFGMEGNVGHGPISEVEGQYDVAIIDMPYNLYTSATPEDQLSILMNAYRFAEKLIVVTLDNLDGMIQEAGYVIKDRCIAKKAGFSREVVVCQRSNH